MKYLAVILSLVLSACTIPYFPNPCEDEDQEEVVIDAINYDDHPPIPIDEFDAPIIIK